MNIIIGSDHRGFIYKEQIKERMALDDRCIVWIDIGIFSQERSDYPLLAYKVAQYIQQEKEAWGVLLCATGVGMSIAVNRFRGIYGALVWNVEVARLSREHDHANVLILPADWISIDQVCDIIKVWISTKPNQGRYKDRIDMIDAFGGVEIE